jgi:4-hydroxythreonine-4-phosphate dehydrogenase
MDSIPRLLITMGDVAGIGPEVIARAWPAILSMCQPVVVGDPDWLNRALSLVGSKARAAVVADIASAAASPERVPCLVCTRQNLSDVATGHVSAAAGRAAYDFLCTAIDRTLSGEAQCIVTAPLHKEGLRAAGLHYPGHTEILAERTGTTKFAMMLYNEPLGVIHVTLHMALRDVFRHLSQTAVEDNIRLLHGVMQRLLDRAPRIGVAALNPHASDGGLFGHEEVKIIEPAVRSAQAAGIDATGPWPSDTLFLRAHKGDFDGIVAMYHDQGHIAIKLLSGLKAVNISVGLPIVRTSVAHGTAYDIAGQGIADAGSMIEAVRVAALLTRRAT